MNYEEFLDSAGIGPAQTEGQGQSQAGKVEGDLWKSAAKEKWPLADKFGFPGSRPAKNFNPFADD
jgi:hypothetical protein